MEKLSAMATSTSSPSPNLTPATLGNISSTTSLNTTLQSLVTTTPIFSTSMSQPCPSTSTNQQPFPPTKP